jgi:L-fucose mutarotase
MLKDIDPLLTADLLSILRSMGHGDSIAIVDRNFPATSVGRRVVDLSGARLDAASKAILSVLPVDSFVEPAVFRMGVVDDPAKALPVHAEFQEILNAAEGRDVSIAVLERFAFYEMAREAYAVVYTGDERPYGCFVVTKGVV